MLSKMSMAISTAAFQAVKSNFLQQERVSEQMYEA